MKSTKGINAIDFNALARLTKDNKAASVIMLLAIDVSNHGQVSLTNKAVVDATSMDKKSVSMALRYLREKRFLLQDPVAANVYHVNSKLLRTYNTRTLNDADYFPEFSAELSQLATPVKPKREQVREVERMNKLSDCEIAESINSNTMFENCDSGVCPGIENVTIPGHREGM